MEYGNLMVILYKAFLSMHKDANVASVAAAYTINLARCEVGIIEA